MKIVSKNTFRMVIIFSALVSSLYASRFFLSNRGSLGHTLNMEIRANTTNATSSAGSAANSTAAAQPAAGNSTAPAASAAGSNSTASNGTAGGSGTGVFKGQTNSSNALGYVGPTNYSISQAPYTVKSCDQVLLIPAQRIVDYKDYCKKQDAFFTMSIYMLNVFEAQDSNKLLESMTMDKLTNMPSHLPGAPGCIDFQSSNSRISVCVKSEEAVDELIEAYIAFQRCRKGDNLDWRRMYKILQDCMMGKPVNASQIGSLTGMSNSTHGANMPGLTQEGNLIKAKNMTDINPYYSDLKVPGS